MTLSHARSGSGSIDSCDRFAFTARDLMTDFQSPKEMTATRSTFQSSASSSAAPWFPWTPSDADLFLDSQHRHTARIPAESEQYFPGFFDDENRDSAALLLFPMHSAGKSGRTEEEEDALLLPTTVLFQQSASPEDTAMWNPSPSATADSSVTLSTTDMLQSAYPFPPTLPSQQTGSLGHGIDKSSRAAGSAKQLLPKPNNSDSSMHEMSPPHCDMNMPSSMQRPDLPYSALIAQAIVSSPTGRLSLKQIYAWIKDAYPFFRAIRPAWQVSHSFFDSYGSNGSNGPL